MGKMFDKLLDTIICIIVFVNFCLFTYLSETWFDAWIGIGFGYFFIIGLNIVIDWHDLRRVRIEDVAKKLSSYVKGGRGNSYIESQIRNYLVNYFRLRRKGNFFDSTFDENTLTIARKEVKYGKNFFLKAFNNLKKEKYPIEQIKKDLLLEFYDNIYEISKNERRINCLVKNIIDCRYLTKKLYFYDNECVSILDVDYVKNVVREMHKRGHC